MSYALYNAINNGAQSNPGLSAAQLSYLQSQFDKAQTIRSNIRTDPRFSTAYETISELIEYSISEWRSKYGYSESDNTIYYDANNNPYKKNGDILVIVDDRAHWYNDDGSVIKSQFRDVPYFDLRYNRVVVTPAAIERMRLGQIQMLRDGGNPNVAADWRNMTLADVILHEPGHRPDSAGAYANKAMEARWSNTIRDHSTELLEWMGQIVDGRDPTVPHGFSENPVERPTMRYMDSSGNWKLIRTTVDADLAWRVPSLFDPPARRVIKGLDGNFYAVDDLSGRTTSISPGGGVLGRMAGSSLGNYLTRNDGTLAQIASSTVLGSIGEALGNTIAINGANIDLSKSVDAAFADFDQTLYNQLKSASVGALSAYTTMELGRALGLSGFGAELFNAASGTVVAPIYDKVLGNIAGGNAVFDGFNLKDVFGGSSGFGNVVGSGIASFFGAKLGSLVISPTTAAGATLASLGSAAGAYALSGGGSAAIGGVAAKIFGQLGQFANIIGPGIGAFVGFVLGALFGSLFGKKKPRIPTANADVVLSFYDNQYQMSNITSANGGDRILAVNMAQTARDTLNGLIDQIADNRNWDLVSTASPTQSYGHYANQIRASFMGGSWQNFSSADEAVEWGILKAVDQTKISGGNLFRKRALLTSPATTVGALLGDLQVSYDYELYMLNREAINSLIEADPNSEFSAAWITTLARANELGLNKFQLSDFYGGLQGFVNSVSQSGTTVSIAYEKYRFRNDDYWQLISDAGDDFNILPNGYYDSIDFKGTAIADIGYHNVWTQAPSMTAGNDLADWSKLINVFPSGFNVDGLGGDDILLGGYLADNIRGSAGFDWINGDSGNDVIDGGGDDDVLIGDAGSDRISGGLGNDYLAGGSGDDYFFDANRTWGLYGNAGNDILVGGAGLDSLYGDDGDDLFVVDQDGGTTWDVYHGQAGSDTVSYERFNSGISINLDNRGSFSWDSQAISAYGDGIATIENLTGTQFSDTLIFDYRNNIIRGLGGNDTIYAGAGYDILEGGAGADRLYGHGDVDTASYEHSSAGVIVDFSTGTALGGDATGDLFYEIENLRGSAHSDDLTGNAGFNTIEGLAGDDVFRWTAGNDIIQGGTGFDTFDLSAAPAAVNVSYAYTAEPTATISGMGSTRIIGIEAIIGTAFNDIIEMASTGATESQDNIIDGGAGNDTLEGGAGADTYIFRRGSGSDTIYENSYFNGNDVIALQDELDWRDISIAGAGGSNLVVSIRGSSDSITAFANFNYVTSGSNAGIHNHLIKGIALGAGGQLDVSLIDWTPAGAGSESGTTIYGAQNKADVIFAYGGNDTIYAAGSSSAYENRGNIIYAGDGNDSIYSSSGDDQFIFERGNGVDTLRDTGGIDTIVMGPSVNPEDVIFEVKVTGTGPAGGQIADLYIGIRDLANPALKASQVADRIRVVQGGTKFVGTSFGTQTFNSIEHIRVGGQELDLSKADISWVTGYYDDSTGGAPIPPIAIDLDGDGIELRSVVESQIHFRSADGKVERVGWVGSDDGILALDRNGNGEIEGLSEISFIDDMPGAVTDLEGLAAFDTNGDRVFDAADARWSEFRIWQDRNQDGVSSANELSGLREVGIVGIELDGAATGFGVDEGIDNVVAATTTIRWEDSSRIGRGYDVMLARETIGADNSASLASLGDIVEYSSKLGITFAQAWANAGSVALGERDTSADNIVFQKPTMSDEQKRELAKAEAFYREQAALAKEAADRQARLDEESVKNNGPTPIPTQAELERLRRVDQFRLTGTQTDPQTAATLAARTNEQERVGQSTERTRQSDIDTSDRISDQARNSAVSRNEGARDSQVQRASVVSSAQGSRAHASASADVSDYKTDIRTANARLLQALAGFGEKAAMLAGQQMTGIEGQGPGWMTIANALPSIHNLEAIR